MNMNEGQMIQFIRRVIREELAAVSMAQVISNEDQLRMTFQQSTSSPPFQNSRNIQPYGLSSRAPAGTPCLTAPVGNNPTNINVIGVHDPDKPDMEDGEVKLYNAFGQSIYLKDGSIHFGVPDSAHPVTLGDINQSVLSQILAIFIAHTHPAPGYPPTNASDASDLKASPVDNGGTVSTVVFTE